MKQLTPEEIESRRHELRNVATAAHQMAAEAMRLEYDMRPMAVARELAAFGICLLLRVQLEDGTFGVQIVPPEDYAVARRGEPE